MKGTYLVIIFSLGAIVGIITILRECAFDNTKVIEYKYIYFDRTRGIERLRYNDVMNSSSEDIARKIDDRYKTVISHSYSGNLSLNEKFSLGDHLYPKFLKVGIIEYSEDSILVKVQGEFDYCCKPQHIKLISWVPSITLHDTLPPNLQNTLKE